MPAFDQVFSPLNGCFSHFFSFFRFWDFHTVHVFSLTAHPPFDLQKTLYFDTQMSFGDVFEAILKRFCR